MKIRKIERKDSGLLCEMIHELAEFEKLSHLCKITESDIIESFFLKTEALAYLLETEFGPVGYAILYFSYSTFLGRRGLHLEDIYVRPAFRNRGYGRMALTQLAQLAVENNCQRFEWAVLDWNTQAMDFYNSLGARPLKEWITYRLDGGSLMKLAAEVSGK